MQLDVEKQRAVGVDVFHGGLALVFFRNDVVHAEQRQPYLPTTAN
jgi:hypothetical protein